MKTKVLLAALAIALTPAIAAAECSYGQKQAMTCAAGSVWDGSAGKCVVTTG